MLYVGAITGERESYVMASVCGFLVAWPFLTVRASFTNSTTRGLLSIQLRTSRLFVIDGIETRILNVPPSLIDQGPHLSRIIHFSWRGGEYSTPMSICLNGSFMSEPLPML